MKKCIGQLVAFVSLAAIVTGHAQILVSDDFSDGNRTNNPAWFINTGSFDVSFEEANNNNSTFNQFFTTSFTAVELDDQEGLRLTLSYRPEGNNLSTVRVGFFDGVPPTADDWAQFTAGEPTRDWRGYLASIGVDGNIATEIRRNDNDTDNHAFFIGTTIGAAGTTIDTAGSADFRWIRFEMYRNQNEMVLQVYEGPTLEGLVSLGQVTDDGDAFFDGFNNLAFYHTTTDGQNGHMRYDNITLELFSNASALDQPILSIASGDNATILLTLSNLTEGAQCNVWTGSFPGSGSILTNFVVTNSVESLMLAATNTIEIIWAETTPDE